MEENKKKQLPTIPKLFDDSWELFKNTWVSYSKLLGLLLAFVFLGALIGIVISLPLSFIAFGSHFQIFHHLTPFNIALFVLLCVWAILYFFSLIAVGVVFPIVSIYILQGKKTASLIDLIKQSKRFFWPYFFTMLLTAFMVWGGTTLLVIPGLLFVLFFAFVSYEIVIGEKRGVTALKRSYVMIKSYFWEVLGRLVLLEIGIIIVTSILYKIAQGDALLSLVQLLFSLFVSWFARSYVFLLYKEVRAKTTFPEQISLRWIWIVTIIGWVIMAFLVFGVLPQVSHQWMHQHQNHLRSATHPTA